MNLRPLPLVAVVQFLTELLLRDSLLGIMPGFLPF